MTSEEKKIVGKVYDIQGFSVHDGPGIRTTVFTKGCPLKCRWCHSPESQAYHSQLCWFELRCIGTARCGLCISACPKGAVTPGKLYYSEKEKREIEHPQIDRSLCDDCGKCADVCTSQALFMSGRDYTVAEVLEQVLKDRAYFERSGGGVTISGGECLTQPAFTIALLKGLKENNIHTAVDTTGFVQYDILRKTLPYTDLYLYDLKHMDDKQHIAGTGVPCGLIKDNALKLAADGGKLQIRIPVIPGYNDSDENIRAVCELCVQMQAAGPGSVTVIQLLPYHKLGIMKYDRLGVAYALKDTEPPSDERMEQIKNIVESYGLPCIIH